MNPLNNRGMTYLEVLMAAALLSIIMVPVLSGFFNAAQNQRYAQMAYEASLYAANMLTEAGAGIIKSGDGFAAVLRNPAFDTEYRTDEFDYLLYVYESGLDGLSLIFFAATEQSAAPDAPAPVFAGDHIPQNAAPYLPVEHIVMVEVYDKRGTLLNRMAAPVYWRSE